MKTIYDRDPKFSVTHEQSGVEITFSVRLSAQEYLTTAADDEDNEAHLNALLQSASLLACPQVLSLLHKAHSEFEKALLESYLAQVRSRHTSNSNNNESADTTTDRTDEPQQQKEAISIN